MCSCSQKPGVRDLVLLVFLAMYVSDMRLIDPAISARREIYNDGGKTGFSQLRPKIWKEERKRKVFEEVYRLLLPSQLQTSEVRHVSEMLRESHVSAGLTLVPTWSCGVWSRQCSGYEMPVSSLFVQDEMEMVGADQPNSE